MAKFLKKKDTHKLKNESKTFYIDCSQLVKDKEFLKKKIKVNKKTGNLGNDVTLTKENNKIVVNSCIPFSKRYLKYLTKKYLKREALRNYVYLTATDKSTYQLKYFNIEQDQGDEE